MGISLKAVREWTAHPAASPVNERGGSGFVSRANGTRSCCGGWQFEYDGAVSGHRYRVSFDAAHEQVEVPGDAIAALVISGTVEPDTFRFGTRCYWDYLCGMPSAPGRIHFSSLFTARDPGGSLTVRTVLRWTASGSVEWSEPSIEDLGKPCERPPVRVAVVTGTEEDARQDRPTLAEGVEFYAGLAQRACRDGAELVALPEIGPQWHIQGHAFDTAVTVPGPVTERFSEIAREHACTLVVGLLERDGDAVFNSAVVIDASGGIAGVYRKVHLASFEAFSGVLPGAGFPVYETAVGRIGCNICMDSSAAESSRMAGLNGADFLVLPIMGDHRASVWHKGSPALDQDRWRSIMRTRALDNQLTMVVARNCSAGSCIIDRSGKILAYNDGTEDFVVADVVFEDDYRKWNGGCFREVNWHQRRPQVYGAFTQSFPVAMQRFFEE